MMKPKSSGVWKYFSECENEKAKCVICDTVISRKGRSTSGLMTHLKSKHTKEYSEMKEMEKLPIISSKPNPTPLHGLKRQLTINESITRNQFWDSSHPRAIEIDNLIGEMIAIQDLPFNFVQGVGFQRLIAVALLHYKLRGREYFTDHICQTIYGRIRQKIIDMLRKFNKLSFTTDIWSEPSAGVSLISLTAHGVTDEFRRVNMVLKCESIDGSHRGEIVESKIMSILNEWEIPNKVHCIVRDQGSNMVHGLNLSNLIHTNCAVHQLQLCVQAGLLAEETITNVITKSKQIATHFNHSTLAQDKLRQIQTERLNQTPLIVFQDCSTRWNSTFYMMERLLKIKDSLILYSTNCSKIAIPPEYWLMMEECVQVLRPFEEITRELSSSNAIISSVIPLIYILKTNLQNELSKTSYSPAIKNVILKLISEINTKFGRLHKITLYTVATYLDPRYKLKFFDSSTKENVQSEVCKLIVAHAADVQICDSPPNKRTKTTESSNNQRSPQSQAGFSQIQQSIQNFIDTNVSDTEDDVEETSLTLRHANEIIANYNKEKKINISEDPLLWWKENSSKFTNLVPLVMQFLSTPPGSVPSEQLFSGAGLIYNSLRTRLKCEKAAKLLFVKYNLALLKFDY